MNRIFKRTKWLYILAALFLVTLIALFITMDVNANKWVVKEYNQHLYSGGTMIGEGELTDRNGNLLVRTVGRKRIYNSNAKVREATLHVVGDAEGFISTGAQTAFKSQLTGYNLFNGLYHIHKDNRYDLQLTIDTNLSVVALDAMGSHRGTVGVYNYKTGEILAAVSCPTFDIEHKPNFNPNDKRWSGVYMNRFFSGSYTPGSTFKVITTECALENIPNILNQTFYCPGYYRTSSGGTVKCNGVHGRETFTSGLNHSCNTQFAEIAAAQLDNEKMDATAKEFGFNQSIDVNGIKCKASYCDFSHAYTLDRAWGGIGQYTTMVNPCHEATIMGSIANRSGNTPKPTLIKKTLNLGTLDYISADHARTLDDLLRSNVTNYYTDAKFPNLQMAGKTGTAQVSNGLPHTWFAGYSQRDDLPLVIVVVLENSGGYGLTDAIPVANKVMQRALQLYVK